MRATEFLTEQTAPDGSKLIAESGDLWMWEVPAHTYQAVYEKYKTKQWRPAQPLPANHGAIYYVSETTHHTWDHNINKFRPESMTPDVAVNQDPIYYMFLTSQGPKLIHLVGSRDITPGLLKKIAQLSGAVNAPGLDPDKVKRHVLYKGQVRHVNKVLTDFELAPLSTGAKVYQVPHPHAWAVGIRYHADDSTNKKWDTRWRIDSPIVGTYSLYSQGGTVNQHWFPANKAVAAVKEIQELAKRENLTLAIQLPDTVVAAAKVKTVKPNSVMHKMLAYVDGHPGATRSDWFVKHLGNSAQGMQGWSSDKAHDGVAAAMGWIKNEGAGSKYSLHITPMGKLVLARLNAGHPVKHTKQV